MGNNRRLEAELRAAGARLAGAEERARSHGEALRELERDRQAAVADRAAVLTRG